MSQHERHPDLTGLLRGELSNDEALDTGQHLDSCTLCQGELAELAVGHALLSAAARVGQPDASRSGVALVAQPPRRRTVLLGVAVAAAVVTVVGTAIAMLRPEPPAPVTKPPTQVATLAAVKGQGNGSVQMTVDHDQVAMKVETHDLPQAGAGHYYYLWLLDPTTNKMLPLGVISPGGTASFELPRSLLGRYQAVDVSLESDDGDPAHSVRSVLRGRYA